MLRQLSKHRKAKTTPTTSKIIMSHHRQQQQQVRQHHHQHFVSKQQQCEELLIMQQPSKSKNRSSNHDNPFSTCHRRSTNCYEKRRICFFLCICIIGALSLIYFTSNDVSNNGNNGNDISANKVKCRQQHNDNNHNDIPSQIFLNQQQEQQIFEKLPSFHEFHSNIRFVFTIGLEGTGHHLLKALTKHAPFVKALTPGFQHDQIGAMGSFVFQAKNTHGALLSAFCDVNNIDNTPIDTPKPNDQQLLNVLVQKLQQINDQVVSNAVAPLPTDNITTTTTLVQLPVTIPLNSYRMTLEHFGMMSYPNYNSNCRDLNYFNLELFYRACNIAKVDCGHLYMYRDSYSIIKSTSINRKFNKHPLTAIQLYIAHLSIIYTQLKIHSARTIGCVGFYEAQYNVKEIMDPIYKLFGWQQYPFNFTSLVKDSYRPPPTLTIKEQRQVVPPEYQIYMKSMEKLGNKVIELCRKQANYNKFL